jgi:Bifunctional DNA primase/polymerase, N-terminal
MAAAGPDRDLPKHDEPADRVAVRRPEVASGPRFADLAPKLLDMGYAPLPLRPGEKRPAVDAWSTVPVNEAQVDAWCRDFASCGIGLRTGNLVGIDIDILDHDLADEVAGIVLQRLGPAVMRVGLWPKRLFIYRAETAFAGRKRRQFEVLALGQQMAAFAIHPVTGQPYYWPDGESPLDVPLSALTPVDEAAIEALIAELGDRIQPMARSPGRSGTPGGGATRDDTGRVVDGRDGWLSAVAYHAVQDVLDRGRALVLEELVAGTWARFASSTELLRPRQGGPRHYEIRDARRKVRDKLRLHALDLLPRRPQPVLPEAAPTTTPADEARITLAAALQSFSDQALAWHSGMREGPAPRLGIRATVGLGKSSVARRVLGETAAALKARNLPHRILVLVPSLALADETAAQWAQLGFDAAVLRGYQANDPVSHAPMCRDLVAAKAATEAGFGIQGAVCFRSKRKCCAHFEGCGKQANRALVAKAGIVVAAYDAMFTGIAGDDEGFALVVVDEACWPRSFEAIEGLTVEALPYLGIVPPRPSQGQDSRTATLADVIAARQELTQALAGLPSGPVAVGRLEGIDAAFCLAARDAEWQALPNPKFQPGQGVAERKAALIQSGNRAIGLKVMQLWTLMAGVLSGQESARGKIWLRPATAKHPQRPIRLYGTKSVAQDLVGLPLLHLDATLRPALAARVLPDLETRVIEASAPHQHVRLIQGSFGKGAIVPDSRVAVDEQKRRANRLAEVVAYVRWNALRHAGKRCLVITYKGIEADFRDIPGVEVAHYNAVAGRDIWSDVACLFLIGRPLPSSQDLAEIGGAMFDSSGSGRYQAVPVGVNLESGRTGAISAIRHSDAAAEVMRAAICDDEVMQALGRGRGINRGADDPLEVHQLADVVLPIAYDRIMPWDRVRPDIVQEMLLAGLAVDSPADAAALHPALFASGAAADSAFRRSGFNRQNPIGNSYREMTVKSARYRRAGRGRGWQQVWWIEGSADTALERLLAAVGPLEGWVPG